MGILNRLRASFLGEIVRVPMRREARRFLAAAADCRSHQHRVLQNLVALNGDSRFSKERRLHEVKTPADLRSRIPVTNFDTYADAIEQVKEGDHRALLGSGNRLLMFTLSSGTTDRSKFIPITERFLEDYRRGWQIWGIQAYDAHPVMNARNIMQLTSDHDRFRTSGGTPCGNISGLAAGMQKRIVKLMYTVPGAVAKITDPEAKNYTTLRLALADDNIGMVTTANPSTLVHLARMADLKREQLIRDVADGTLSEKYDVAADVRNLLRRRTGRRNKGRAQQLERIVERTAVCFPKTTGPESNWLPSGPAAARGRICSRCARTTATLRCAITDFRPAKAG